LLTEANLLLSRASDARDNLKCQKPEAMSFADNWSRIVLPIRHSETLRMTVYSSSSDSHKTIHWRPSSL
jgi:hypothetical protein